jgi:hypothetical protein
MALLAAVLETLPAPAGEAVSHTGGGIQQYGGSPPPLDSLAQDTLGRMRGHMQAPRPMPPLTEQERAEAERAQHCLFCAGIHAGMSTPACPRLASGKLDGDGRLAEFTFWPGTDWADGRVIFAEDAAETEQEAGDGN